MSGLAPPIRVTLVSSGFEGHKELLSFLVSLVNLIATICIPLLMLRYSRKQDERQQQQAAQQRLQGHVTQLSGDGGAAMQVISKFKDDCDFLNLQYANEYKKMQQRSRSSTNITAEQLQQVDLARRQLQGIWDNIMDDYRADLLGAPITDPRHGRILLRGLVYLELVEPLDAANFTLPQKASDRVAADGQYVLPGSAIRNVTVKTQQNSVAAATTIKSRYRARPTRYRWLEDQRTLQLTGKPLWDSNTVQGNGAMPAKVKWYSVDPGKVEALQQGWTAEQQAWGQALAQHWANLLQACAFLTTPVPGSAAVV